jgi:hypothetical protein
MDMEEYDNILVPQNVIDDEPSEQPYINFQTKTLTPSYEYYRIHDGQLQKRVPNYRIVEDGEVKGYRDGSIIEDAREWKPVRFTGGVRLTQSSGRYYVLHLENGVMQFVREQ